jgi:serine/threonine protein kinase
LELEKCNNNLDGVRREAQIMSLIDHPNVLKAHCSFIVDHSLWVVMPYMSGESCLHITKSAYPDGFEGKFITTFQGNGSYVLGKRSYKETIIKKLLKHHFFKHAFTHSNDYVA